MLAVIMSPKFLGPKHGLWGFQQTGLGHLYPNKARMGGQSGWPGG